MGLLIREGWKYKLKFNISRSKEGVRENVWAFKGLGRQTRQAIGRNIFKVLLTGGGLILQMPDFSAIGRILAM
jgi:hypothetical protein